MSNTVITISREFCSGGRLVGKKLALELGIPVFSKEIIQLAAEKSGLSPNFIEKSEDHITTSFLFNIVTATHPSQINSTAFMQYDVPVTDKAFFAQSAVIKELAAKSDCIILGRCADYILEGTPGLVRVFLHSTEEDKIRRATQQYNFPADGIAELIRKTNKKRASYHKHYTGLDWGDTRSYDISINIALTGIDGAVTIIKTLLDQRAKHSEQ